jgi:DNA modification methylase
MAAKMKRNRIGSEISENYVQLANKRIKAEHAQLTLF